MKDKVIVTVVGKDKVGIIAAVTGALAESHVNILDISQTIMQEFFTMIMVCDMTGATVDLTGLKEGLDQKGEEIGVKITVQHEKILNSCTGYNVASPWGIFTWGGTRKKEIV